MADVQEAIRRLTIEARARGVAETEALMRRMIGTQNEVVASTEKNERATQSLEKRLESIQRRYDAEYRKQKELIKLERDLDAARAQGLLTPQRQRELLAMAASGHTKEAAGVASLTGAYRQFAGTLATLGVTLGAAGAVAFVKTSVSSLAELYESAERIGVTTDALQALRFELKQSGGDVSQAERALAKFADMAVTAGHGGGVLAKVLKDNGVSFKDQNGNIRDASALLSDYAGLVANAGTQSEKLALASEVFGQRVGPKMIAVLERIAKEGLPGLIKQATEAGQVIDEGLLKAADSIDDRWNAMLDGILNKLKALVVETVRAGEEIAKAAANAGSTPSPLTGLMDAEGFGLTQGGELAQGGLPSLQYRDVPFPRSRPSMPTTPARRTITTSLGGRGGETKANDYERATKAIEKQTEALQIQIDTFGMTTEAGARYRIEQELLNAAKLAGIKVGDAEREKIAAMADSYAAATTALELLREQQQRVNEINDAFRDSFKGLVSDFRSELANGATAWEAFEKAGFNALNKLTDKLIDMAINNVWENAFPKAGKTGMFAGAGGGGLLGGFLIPGILHDGGMAGSAPSSGRYIHQAYFDDAPRFHAGKSPFGPNEMPAIIDKREEVDYPANLARKYGGGGDTITVTMVDQRTFNDTTPQVIAVIQARDKAEWPKKKAEIVNEMKKRRSGDPNLYSPG